MFREPIVIDGFYATRLIARRAVKFAAVTILVMGALALGTISIIAGAIDVLLISWSMG